ncbi:cardiolipin synthase [Parablautia sp. Marseille-Q6255]|uniref:cardiolipin synthase n=1 Tax=Parablautia sp. Marseille-Q6255 TaxID=3039593 RepID=UPI0024BBF69B|nr:cardiolipin synthase [Parablautia sp. Marseille-Q6255]
MKQDSKETGLYLLKKGKQGIFRMIFSRSGLILVLLTVQVLFLFSIFHWFEEFLPHIYGGVVIFTVFMVLYLLNSSMDPTAKITWLVVVMLLPVFGALLFLYTQKNIGHRALRDHYAQLNNETQKILMQDPKAEKNLQKSDSGAAALTRYVRRSGCYPVYEHIAVTYFPLGEDKFKEMLIQLEKAEHFIFLEYFIVNEGEMWGKILEILVRKVKEGVDVRMLYDGTCELSTLPHDYPQRLRRLGIQCKMFAPIKPFVSTHYNYRDHRKILVIDGNVAFNGGINLADEYINAYEKYGHWKDTAVMVQGEAARSFTRMFLHMWFLDEKEKDFESFLNIPIIPQVENGFVMPYGDCPLDKDKVGEQVYMDMLNRAQNYVHIMTPYLILDGELENSLKYAAERGVDVRIILPGIPDKYIPFALALTHYKSLLNSGVKIYEYTPGFVHAKVFVCDDREAVVGTINLDYRSLYHHFECATYMWGTSCIPKIVEDFNFTQNKCREITVDMISSEPLKRRALGFIAKAAAPLL